MRFIKISERIVDIHDKKVAIPPAILRKARIAIQNLLKPIYFQAVPLDEIMASLNTFGIKLIQEDGEEWAGMLIGADSQAYFNLAYMGLEGRYLPVKNSMLALAWYKMSSGKYEITGYLT